MNYIFALLKIKKNISKNTFFLVLASKIILRGTKSFLAFFEI